MFAAELRADSYLGTASACLFVEVKDDRVGRDNNAYKLM